MFDNLFSALLAWILFNGPDRLGFCKYYRLKPVEIDWRTWSSAVTCAQWFTAERESYIGDNEKNEFVKWVEELEKTEKNSRRLLRKIFVTYRED